MTTEHAAVFDRMVRELDSAVQAEKRKPTHNHFIDKQGRPYAFIGIGGRENWEIAGGFSASPQWAAQKARWAEQGVELEMLTVVPIAMNVPAGAETLTHAASPACTMLFWGSDADDPVEVKMYL
ncbi:MAG: hypothetical protein WAX89_07590 [Alphaproteobacteria bacterium]